MWKFDNIKTGITGSRPLYNILKDYIQEKNLNFIIARGNCVNQAQDSLKKGELDIYLDEFAACGFSMISCQGEKPSPPFLAGDIDPEAGTARITFLIDLTREAEDGKASPFYSKMLGALATQFFAAQPGIHRLELPFTLRDTIGRGVTLAPMDGGTALVRSDR
jgi:hypothetical protein